MLFNCIIYGTGLIPQPPDQTIHLMELNALRTFYSIGNYSAISPDASDCSPEAISIIFKARLQCGDDLAKCSRFLSAQSNVSDLLKRALLLWSKVFLKPAVPSSERMAFKELAGKAHEAAEIDSEERDQVILTAAEALLISGALSESFELLKLVKASNLDCQVIFIEILIKLGQIRMAQDRLEKMRNIPEWKDDVRFLLIEARLGLHTTDSTSETEAEGSRFTAKDSLYSYQELAQVHGQTPLLSLHLAAAYVLLGKFAEAQTTILSMTDGNENKANSTSVSVQANSNLILLAALFNDPNFSKRLK